MSASSEEEAKTKYLQSLVNPVNDYSLYQENTLVGSYYDELDVLRSEILKYWKGKDAQIAWNVMMAESGGIITAINPADRHNGCMGSYGLFQLSCDKAPMNELVNYKTNIRMAYELWQKNGWNKDWGVCKNGMVECK